MTPLVIRIPNLVTRNTANNSQGTTRGGMIARARERKGIRNLIRLYVLTEMRRAGLTFDNVAPCIVTVTRIAPSRGLDAWDGLPGALKPCVDGVADAFGLTDDRDSRIEWRCAQERGKPRQYGIRVTIEGRASAEGAA